MEQHNRYTSTLIVLALAIMINACDAGQRGLAGSGKIAVEGSSFPPFIGHTLQGRTIDNSVFTDRVTLVSAWRLGCRWSMEEIPEYNRLLSSINDPRFQMISLAPQTRDEMEQFYAADTGNPVAQSREEMNAEIPQYDVLPMCSTKRQTSSDPVGAQCNALEDLLGVEVFPVTLIVGPDGVIRHRHEGLIVDPATYEPDISPFKRDLDSLLRVL